MVAACQSSIVQTVAPTELPLTLDEVKAHLRIEDNEEDALILGYLQAAVEYAQEYQWSQLCTATFVERFDCFPCEITLMRNPVQSVTSVAYVDTGAVTQTLVANTDYVVDTYSKPCRIIPAYSKWWPTTRGYMNDVVVTYVAGYASVGDIPAEVRQAILMQAAAIYSSRGGCETSAMVEKAIQCLLDKRSFRVFY